MSIAVSNKIWAANFGTPTKKLVALALGNWSDDWGGRLYPSIRAIASRALISRSQARRLVHQLIKDGVLSVDESCKNPRGRATQYRLNLVAIDALPRAYNCVGRQRRKHKPEPDDPAAVLLRPEKPKDPSGLDGAAASSNSSPDDIDQLLRELLEWPVRGK